MLIATPLAYINSKSTLINMRRSITQEFEFGCGIACFAFAHNISYEQAALKLGRKQANSSRFWVKDFVTTLNRSGLDYRAIYVKQRLRRRIYAEGTIVLIRRSKNYPNGHYLIRHNDLWMDPWINMRANSSIENASSGFRRRLPGTPMYALLPRV